MPLLHVGHNGDVLELDDEHLLDVRVDILFDVIWVLFIDPPKCAPKLKDLKILFERNLGLERTFFGAF